MDTQYDKSHTFWGLGLGLGWLGFLFPLLFASGDSKLLCFSSSRILPLIFPLHICHPAI